MKKQILLLTLLCFKLRAYESGFEDESESPPAISTITCVNVLQKVMTKSPEAWQETHCKQATAAVIETLRKKGLLEDEQSWSFDLDAFKKSALARQLLEPAQEPEHMLFHINVCGGAHVFIVEKKSDGNKTTWKLIQSWHKEFSLLAWLGITPLNNEKFLKEFLTLGGDGNDVEPKKLAEHLVWLVEDNQDRLARFKEFGCAVPYELVITSFTVESDEYDEDED